MRLTRRLTFAFTSMPSTTQMAVNWPPISIPYVLDYRSCLSTQRTTSRCCAIQSRFLSRLSALVKAWTRQTYRLQPGYLRTLCFCNVSSTPARCRRLMMISLCRPSTILVSSQASSFRAICGPLSLRPAKAPVRYARSKPLALICIARHGMCSYSYSNMLTKSCIGNMVWNYDWFYR